MGTVLVIGYWAGLITTWIVLYQRSGLPRVEPDWREFLLPNVLWFTMLTLKILFWPATLAAWLIQGQPATRWKAVTVLDGRQTRRIIRVSEDG